jgi:hypothetical protein
VPRYHAVVESRHELQNPTSPGKIRALGEYLGLDASAIVLDVASGGGGPAIVLAGAFGCRITCIEKAQEFHAAAGQRVSEAGLRDLIDLIQADARDFRLGEGAYDAALCLGASFVWDGLSGTLEALEPTVRTDGFVVVGEPYWRLWPIPSTYKIDPAWSGDEYVTLPATLDRFRAAGLEPVAAIDASLDDWDRYESLHWLAGEEWLHTNPYDPEVEEIRARLNRDRDAYVRWQRDLLGWAIIVGRKR